jgi:dihydroxyacetone kinase-like protein
MRGNPAITPAAPVTRIDATPRPVRQSGSPRGAAMPGDSARDAGIIDRKDVIAYLCRTEAAMSRHAARLDRLDAALGDGDHGENMVNGWRSVLETNHGGDEDLGHLLGRIGTALVASVGGASGPLYGTAFIEAGFALRGRTTLDLGALATACDAAMRGLARRGRCSVGDKTILDALAPASASLRASADRHARLDAALADAAREAARGMRSTVPLVARRGLALRLGERSRGHQDPGATSCFLIFRAMLPSAARVGNKASSAT